MSLVDDLSGALARGEIVAYFQPQIDILSGWVVAAEALARWDHPRHGVLTPDVFLPAAQQHDLMDAIGSFMVSEAWRCAAAWQSAGTPVQVSVNVAATQFTSPDLADQLAVLLQAGGVPAGTMTIEITETELFSDLDSAAATLRDLRLHGLGVSIDDFGVGHSTLGRLDALPASELKIDLSMIQDETDAGYESLLDVVERAHERGIRVVAEGVETEAQRHRVELLRCERAQGYLYSKPLSERDFGDLLVGAARGR